MYWYYKYPFLLVCLLILFGIGSFIYNRLPERADNAGEDIVEDFSGDETQTERRSEPDPDSQAVSPRPRPNEEDSSQDTVDPQSLPGKQLAAAEAQLHSENFLAARALAHNVLEDEDTVKFRSRWYEAARIVSNANTKLLNSDIPAPEKVRYEIQSGDNLIGIAKKFNTTVASLIRGNPVLDKNNAMIYPGTTLSIYQGDWRIEVDKVEFVLLLMDGDRLFKLYDIATGKHDRTPTGEFVIKNKLLHPDWTPPGRHIPYGDPENVLGTHWLGLRPVGDTNRALSSYGIHGTWEPETIGSEASLGCVRMYNEDVAELFDIVRTGTNVIIKGE